MGLPIHINNIFSKGIKELQINRRCSEEFACVVIYINQHMDKYGFEVDSFLSELDNDLVEIVNDKKSNISKIKYVDFCHNLSQL